MASKRFWRGFAIGAAAGAGGSAAVLLATNMLGANKRVIRLEKSLQIGRPLEEVFQAWVALEQLPTMTDLIREVRRDGDRSHWKAQVDGRSLEWDAEIEQFLVNQAIGWKSLNGPKHTGRITFSPLGDDTLLQVTMNYAPPLRIFRPMLQPVEKEIQACMEKVLRDFKAAMEGKGQEGRRPPVRSSSETLGPGTGMTGDVNRATGTFGAPVNAGSTSTQGSEARVGGTSPVDYTRPPEAKS